MDRRCGAAGLGLLYQGKEAIGTKKQAKLRTCTDKIGVWIFEQILSVARRGTADNLTIDKVL